MSDTGLMGRERFAYDVTAADAETGELLDGIYHTYWSPNRLDVNGDRVVDDADIAASFAAELSYLSKRKHFGVAASLKEKTDG